jgi:hypothetical protein
LIKLFLFYWMEMENHIHTGNPNNKILFKPHLI